MSELFTVSIITSELCFVKYPSDVIVLSANSYKYEQAFTNCLHGYDRARNVHANNVTRVHENSCMVLIPLCKNNLNLPVSNTDHYALIK